MSVSTDVETESPADEVPRSYENAGDIAAMPARALLRFLLVIAAVLFGVAPRRLHTNVNTMLHDNTSARVSEEIESALRAQEAARLRSLQSPAQQLLRGITRFLLFMTRPEAMTAYATAAAALAAFLALKAAERQERATFTSLLYAKQVDALATVTTKSDNLQRLLLLALTEEELANGTPKYFLPQLDEHPLKSQTTPILSALSELEQAILVIDTLYPKSASMFFQRTLADVYEIHQGILEYSILPFTVLGVSINVQPNIKPRMTEALKKVSASISTFRQCAIDELQNSYSNINNGMLGDCLTRGASQFKVPPLPP